MVNRASTKIWMLRHLKALGASRRSLLEIYTKHIRCILEFACPAWTGALTLKESRKLERVQRVVMKLIFESEKKPYKDVLAENKLQKVSDRRKYLALKFAKSAFSHQKFKTWFQIQNTPNQRTKFRESITRTNRLFNSPIPYLTRLLNRNKGHL